MERASFTEAVRQELARLPISGQHAATAELSALVRFAGTLRVRGGDPPQLHIEIDTTSGAVARRVFALLQQRFHVRPELLVRAPGGVRRTTYGVQVGPEAARIARELQVVDARGVPTDAVPAQLTEQAAIAYLRGALLASGSISAPGRAPHLELTASSEGIAQGLVALLRRHLGATVSTVDADRPRIVLKSGERIGELLTLVGATRAFLDWDDQRLRRQLRGEATRLANADRANLQRSIDASRTQVAGVEAAIAAVGWDALPDELRGVALARLANPEASLAELGELLDPPVGKSAVHRRLQRLVRLADSPQDEGRAPV